MSNETSNNEVDSIDLSGNDTKKKPKRRLKDIVLGSFVAAFALCVIFFMAVGIFQTYKEVAEGANGTYAEYSESQSGQDNILGDESSSTDAEDKKEEETSSLPLFKDIVYLEAGNTEIVIEELFNEYKGQNCILKKGITQIETEILY